MTSLLQRLLIALACLTLSSAARAACDIVNVISATPSTFNVGNYTATTVPPPVSIAVTITGTKVGNGSCQMGIALLRNSPPAQMVRVPAANVALPYTATYNGSNIIYFAGGTPAIQRVPNFNANNGNTFSVTVSITITPQTPLAAPAAGIYLDPLMLRVYNRNGGSNYSFVGQVPVTVSAASIQSCYLSAPSSLSLNFSSDILQGLPAGAAQSTTFNVNCTGPSRISLSGSALVRPQGVQASGVFDLLINYRTIANFGGASATLITNGTAPVSATSTSASAIVGNNLPVNLNINLIANRPLLSGGSYSGVLRVIVDPAL